MAHIGIWSVVKDGNEAVYNSEVRRLGIDPGAGDSLDVRVWKVADDVELTRQWGSWSHWIRASPSASPAKLTYREPSLTFVSSRAQCATTLPTHTTWAALSTTRCANPWVWPR